MTVKKIELKVTLHCKKCKSEILKAVTKLDGIDQVSLNGEHGILTVLGDVDPVLIAKRVKKTGKFVEIVSVGPPITVNNPIPDNKPTTPVIFWETCYGTPVPLPPCCNQCQFVSYDTQPVCIVM